MKFRQHPEDLRAQRDEDREKYRRQALARPEPAPIIALNHVERDAAREVYQTLEAVMKVGYQRRTGQQFPLDGLNSAQVVDEIIHAINLSRLKQAEKNNVNLR